jgi:hypothetical protein
MKRPSAAARRRRLPPTPPKKSTPGPPRLWNLTGHGKLRGHPPVHLPGPSHARWKSLWDFHSYAQPRRRGIEAES